jgi:hypothetical protein
LTRERIELGPPALMQEELQLVVGCPLSDGALDQVDLIAVNMGGGALMRCWPG